MSELTRGKIKAIRDGGKSMALGATEQGWMQALCDMALRTHDAEQRSQRAEAENAIARTLAKAILESQPHDSAADGVLCVDVWRAKAVRLLQISLPDSEPWPSGIDNLLDEMDADIDRMSDEEIRAEADEDMISPPHDVLQSALRRTGRRVHPTEQNVPDEVRRLPEDWMQRAGEARRCLNDGKSKVYESCARQLDKALAAARSDLPGND